MHNLNHLYYFYIVARLKSVTAAAKHLKTSQPSLSTQIKTLEFNLNKKLFVKKGKFLELTTDGSNIFEICSRMFEIYEELDEYLKLENVIKNNIKIGVSTELSRPFTANIVSDVLKKYKQASRPNVKMETDTHENLVEKLKLKKLDFIITNIPPAVSDLTIIKNFQMPVVLASESELIKKLKIQSLKSNDLILKKIAPFLVMPSEPLKLRSESNYFLFKNKIKYNITFESDILASVIRAAADGIGFCFIPLPYIKKELQNHSLKIVPNSKDLWKHQLFILARDEKDKDQFIKKLIRELELAI
jgi:LysR family transcriptional activator of nhaA